jgi:hypothetical protein
LGKRRLFIGEGAFDLVFGKHIGEGQAIALQKGQLHQSKSP